jgi:hypothetical protein
MPRLMVRRLAVSLLALAAVLALAACGNKPKITTEGATEGSYLNVGDLTYQVQLSRQLNPGDIEDKSYLQGVPPSLAQLRTGQTWFGVFIRVANETSNPALAADNFEITDTQDEVFRPVPQSFQNPFVYHGGVVPAGDLIPKLNDVAGEGVIQGSLILFKLPLSSLDNRPLLFHVTNQDNKTAHVILDV